MAVINLNDVLSHMISAYLHTCSSNRKWLSVRQNPLYYLRNRNRKAGGQGADKQESDVRDPKKQNYNLKDP